VTLARPEVLDGARPGVPATTTSRPSSSSLADEQMASCCSASGWTCRPTLCAASWNGPEECRVGWRSCGCSRTGAGPRQRQGSSCWTRWSSAGADTLLARLGTHRRLATCRTHDAPPPPSSGRFPSRRLAAISRLPPGARGRMPLVSREFVALDDEPRSRPRLSHSCRRSFGTWPGTVSLRGRRRLHLPPPATSRRGTTSWSRRSQSTWWRLRGGSRPRMHHWWRTARSAPPVGSTSDGLAGAASAGVPAAGGGLVADEELRAELA
jgi:hypothetical protein